MIMHSNQVYLQQLCGGREGVRGGSERYLDISSTSFGEIFTQMNAGSVNHTRESD